MSRTTTCSSAISASLVAGQRLHPLELERDVGERLGDAVVELAGDPGSFGLGAERAQAGEPAGVVDREREQARQALHEVALLVPVGVRRDVFECDQTDQRTACAQRHVHPAPAECRETVLVGVGRAGRG